MSTAVVSEPSGFSLPQSQLNVIKWNIYFGFAVLAIGVIMGLDQALNYARVNIFQYYPGLKSYYQGLTIHGVFNALVLTTAFANGFLALTTARGFGRKLNDALLHGAFWTLLVGSLLAVYAMFSRQASVLYTFYPPLQAHWTFYLGLALVVISTWITSAAQLVALRAWRKEHPGERVPLLAFMSIATYVMWDIASVGIAIEVVVFLLPWSLGLFPGVDPMLNRTLFWFTGHPIVYFWLLPIYVSWYGMIPKQAGGVLFSDMLTRVSFIMFILLVPVGFHHQFLDPGISSGLKFTVAGLTFAIFFPSLMTAFSVMYALEIAGTSSRRRRADRMVLQDSMERSFGGGAGARDDRIPARRHLRADERELHHEYGDSQHRVRSGALPSHDRMRGGSLVCRNCLLADTVPRAARTMGAAPRAIPGVPLFLRGDDFLARPDGGRDGRNAAAHRYGACRVWPGFVEDSRNHDRHRRLADVRERDAVLPVLLMTIFAGKKTAARDVPFTATVQPPSTIGWQPRLDRFSYWVLASVILVIAVYGPFILGHFPPQPHDCGLAVSLDGVSDVRLDFDKVVASFPAVGIAPIER